METVLKHRALLERWLKAFRPERIWVNGEGLWECSVCGMFSSAGPRGILHSAGCLWADTSEALEAEREVSDGDKRQ